MKLLDVLKRKSSACLCNFFNSHSLREFECRKMSDSDSSSSSDEDLELHEGESKTVVNPVRKFCFFLTETGHSLNFILLVDNMTESEVTEITNLIQVNLIHFIIDLA